MSGQLTTKNAKQSLRDHVAAKGAEIFAKYGPRIGWSQLQEILDDRSCVRYPCEIAFNAAALQPGEFAHPVAKGLSPEDGFVLHVHPLFMTQPDRVPYLALYQLVAVNYGEFVTADDAEIFGAAALGLPREEYYQAVCALADEIFGPACADGC
jgi:hypothetical protein